MLTNYVLPVFIGIILVVALIKRVDAYSSFIKGTKEGLSLFHEVFPAMMAMMLSISLLRVSGLLEAIASLFSGLLANVDASLWAMMLFRPFSGTASLAIMIDIFKTLGVDSFSGIMASIIQGSTDTTLYVITLYFGSVGVKKIRNSMFIGLISDLAGIAMAIFLTITFFS